MQRCYGKRFTQAFGVHFTCRVHQRVHWHALEQSGLADGSGRNDRSRMMCLDRVPVQVAYSKSAVRLLNTGCRQLCLYMCFLLDAMCKCICSVELMGHKQQQELDRA